MNSHEPHAFGALVALSTILGGIAGDRVVAAIIALGVSVFGQLLLRALTPPADELGKKLLAHVSGKHRAIPRASNPPPSLPPPPPDEPPPSTPPSS